MAASGTQTWAGGKAATFVKKLKNAPFPYYGQYAETTDDFFDYRDPGTSELFHTNRYGQRFSEKDHYLDSSVLFHVPALFQPDKPLVLVVYFHGHSTSARETFREHQLADQMAAAGRNAVLILPQLAVNALDSSPGRFFQKNKFKQFLEEAAGVLADETGHKYLRNYETAPLVLAAFSGGYKSVAYVLDRGGVDGRIKGVLLLDGLFEDEDKFIHWLVTRSGSSFFVSLYSLEGPCREYNRKIADALRESGLGWKEHWPSRVKAGEVALIPVETDHLKIPLNGPPRRPLAELLRGIEE
ncbi:MAG: hypothetical protein AB1896_10095 [Thermodesulfobacteriota bacterium]